MLECHFSLYTIPVERLHNEADTVTNLSMYGV